MRREHKGFTLLEIVIYLAIVGVILSTLSLFLLQLLRVREKTNAISEVMASALLIENRLSEAVRHANDVDEAQSVFGSDPGILTLTMVDVARNPMVFSITADDGQMQVSQAGADPIAITPPDVRVTNLVFTNLTSPTDVGIIQVQFTVEATSSSGEKTFSYDQTFQTVLRIPLD